MMSKALESLGKLKGYFYLSTVFLAILTGLLLYISHLKMQVANVELAMSEQRLAIVKDINEANRLEMVKKNYVKSAISGLEDKSDSLSIQYFNDVIYILRNEVDFVVDSTGRIKLEF